MKMAYIVTTYKKADDSVVEVMTYEGETAFESMTAFCDELESFEDYKTEFYYDVEVVVK
jgi:hypothetical protein